MNNPPPISDEVMDIFLQPGEIYFGDKDTRIRTILGSCVSITLWHPRLCVGGMCHYMLPTRRTRAKTDLDGKYADEAIELLVRDLRARGTTPRDYQVKIFGGGLMFPDRPKRHQAEDVGYQNLSVAETLVEKHGFSVKAKNLGGVGHRNVIFDVWSGDVWVRHVTEVMSTSVEAAT